MSDVTWHGEEFDREIDKLIRKKVVALAQRYMRLLHELFRSAKHGRIYEHGSVTHRASAPGEAPAIDTAALAKSPTFVVEKDGDDWAATIGPSVESGRADVAEYLEFGTARIEARPAWRPALEQLKQEAEATMKEA
jgi:hypothetical protein